MTAIAVCCFALEASAAPIDSDPKQKARALLIEGARLYKRRDFVGALSRFESAYAAFPSPRIHYNFGLAYEGLGKIAQALMSYERFLQDTRDAPEGTVPDAQERVRRLSARVAFVTISSDRSDGEVLLDGVSVGRIPLKLRLPVDVGRHAVVLRGTVDAAQPRTFTASAGESLEVRFDSEDTSKKNHEAEELIRKGVELRRQRKHLESYPLFRRAYELSPVARPMAQLGLVEYQLGKWVDAEDHLEAALRSPSDSFITENRQTISEALEVVRSHVGFIALSGGPEGAGVSVNGRAVGKMPIHGLINANDGYAEVSVSAPGYVTARRTLQIQPQLTSELFVNLEPVSRSGGPVVGTGTEPSTRGSGSDLPGTGRSHLRTVGIVLAALGVGLGSYGAYNSYRVQKIGDQTRPSDQIGVSRGRAFERQQWWGYGLGAGTVAAGGLLFWIGSTRDSSTVALSVATLSPDGSFFVALRLNR